MERTHWRALSAIQAGTNLVGAHNELKRSFKDLDRDRIIRYARRHDVDWKFNPPHASHMGGVWEGMIKTVRCVLYALLSRNTRLSDEILMRKLRILLMTER